MAISNDEIFYNFYSLREQQGFDTEGAFEALEIKLFMQRNIIEFFFWGLF